jgi:hypothetical protein
MPEYRFCRNCDYHQPIDGYDNPNWITHLCWYHTYDSNVDPITGRYIEPPHYCKDMRKGPCGNGVFWQPRRALTFWESIFGRRDRR